MRPLLKKYSEIVALANDKFVEQYPKYNTVLGLIDKNLRQQGMPADAITLESLNEDKKIVWLLHDDTPEVIKIALGNKAGDIFSSTEHPAETFTCDDALTSISAYFKVN